MLSAISFYTFLFLALVVVPASLILAVLVFLDHEQRAWRGGKAIRRHGKIVERWPVIAHLTKRFPIICGFVGRRLDPGKAWGLSATIAFFFILLGTWFLLAVVQDIVAKDPLVVLDIRLHNAVPLFRTAGMTKLMLVVTNLGSATVLTLICLGIAFHALAVGRPRLAAVSVFGLAATGLVSVTLKAVTSRARPLDMLVGAHEASFPSGHLLSGTVVYGLVAFLVLGSRARPVVRAIGITMLLLVIVGIGLSRLYVGVHWPSDLLASLALALVILTSLLFVLHYAAPLHWIDTFRLRLDARAARWAGTASIVLALGTAAGLGGQMEVIPIGPPPASRPIALETLRAGLPPSLPRRSEDIVGGEMEPISLVIVGSEADLNRDFGRAGWTRADPPTPLRVIREAAAAVRNLPDPSGPATPAFFADRPQDLTMEKPDAGAPTIRRRHHIRIWQTLYCLAPACRPLWVATASYDMGVRLSPLMYLPTHLIDPAIDNERALVVSDLTAAGATHAGNLPVVPALRGKNASGDDFWTDGRAELLILP